MPLPHPRGRPFCGRVCGAEQRDLVSALKTWEVRTYPRAHEEAAVAVIPRFTGGQQRWDLYTVEGLTHSKGFVHAS